MDGDASPSLRDLPSPQHQPLEQPPGQPLRSSALLRAPARTLAPIVPAAQTSARAQARARMNELVPLAASGRGAGRSAGRGSGRGSMLSRFEDNLATSPSAQSPSVLWGAELEIANAPSDASAAQTKSKSKKAVPGRAANTTGVLDVPLAPIASTGNGPDASLLLSTAAIGPDESYGNDERVLNEVLKSHPMLSMEATSQKTLQLVASIFDRSNTKVATVPIVPKSYDDAYLRPPKKQIGERECACGTSCIASVMARIRHGPDTDLAFIGTEFLLPAERDKWLSGTPLPTRRKKCLLCTRYMQNVLYVQARTDPNFKVTSSPISMQTFGNPVAPAKPSEGAPRPDLAELGVSMEEMPESASYVSSPDGYKPESMLFVDEEFSASSISSRDGNMPIFSWKPVVKFSAAHYRYTKSSEGPFIVQVGIGADDPTGTGLGFREPPAEQTVPSVA